VDNEQHEETQRHLAPWQEGTARLAEVTVTLVIDVLVILTVVILLWSVWAVASSLFTSIVEGKIERLTDLMVGVLTTLIFIEVFNLSVKYIRTHTVSVKDLCEVSLAVIFREVWVGLFAHSIEWPMVLALSVLILAIAAVRAAEGARLLRGSRPQPEQAG
jgi:uncharacterized membrane protein (DUF373 family)